MGADAADRTLFVGNLHPRTTEELLFELFLQAGPAVSVKIPKDKDGKPKLFAFVNFKHEESVPYGMNLLNGVKLFGRPINIQFRSGSTHISQDTSQSPRGNATAGNSQSPNGSRQDGNEDVIKYDIQNNPSYQRSYSSPDNLQRQAMMNNFYKQESPQGCRAHLVGEQPSPPSSGYTPNNSWYSPSSNYSSQRRYDSPPGHRNSRNVASHPYKNNESYHNRDMYSRVGREEHHYRRHGPEEDNYRSRGQERSSPNYRNDPRWGPPHH